MNIDLLIDNNYSPWINTPWGKYRTIFKPDKSSNLAMKILHVDPHKRTSLQYHHLRAELWYVLQGNAEVDVYTHPNGYLHRILLKPEEHILIPVKARHRLSNTGDEPLVIYETWMGEHLSEDDITRLQDDYGRLTEK